MTVEENVMFPGLDYWNIRVKQQFMFIAAGVSVLLPLKISKY